MPVVQTESLPFDVSRPETSPTDLSAVCLRVSSAFTIAELLVAMVIMATALAGVYGLFRQAIGAEARIAAKWELRNAAESIVRQMADTVEQGVMLPNMPGLTGGPDDRDGSFYLTCYTMDSGDISPGALVCRRFRWDAPEADREGYLELQTIPFAGSKPLLQLPAADDQNAGNMDALWKQTAVVDVAKRIDSITVLYKPISDPDAKWDSRWGGSLQDVIVWMRVVVGGQVAERVIVPHVEFPLIAQQ